MLTILPPGANVLASTSFAHQCWHHNPALSPNFWREWPHGATGSKVVLNWQEQVHQAALMPHGLNVVLVSPGTFRQACQTLHSSPTETILTVLVSPVPQLEADLPPPSVLLWQPPTPLPGAPQLLAALTQLEQLVQQGHLAAYGLADASQALAQPVLPLHEWLALAAQAAESVYQRRKRPALRYLLAPFDLLNLHLLFTPSTRHQHTPVSPLELAARLNLGVFGQLESTPAAPPPQALQALQQLAVQEHQLNQQLQGWPQINGQPLFSVLAALQSGQAPWPTPVQALAWQQYVWPTLMPAWHTVLQQHPSLAPTVSAYQQAWHHVLPQLPSLAVAAAQSIWRQVGAEIAPKLPAAWQPAALPAQQVALLSSAPGLTGLVLPTSHSAHLTLAELQQWQKWGDIPDFAAALINKIENYQ